MKDVLGHSGEEALDEGRALIKAESTAVGQERRDPYASVALGSALDEGTDLAVTLRQYLYMVLKRKWLILGVALVFFVLGGVRVLLQTPLYSATVRIQIEREPVKIVEGGMALPPEEGPDFLRTQYELLKSQSMAERVVSMLHLNEDESLFKPRGVSALGLLSGALSSSKRELPSLAAREAWAAGIVHGSVQVLPVPGSRLVDVTYIDPSPARAQQIANGYADAFVASSLDKRIRGQFLRQNLSRRPGSAAQNQTGRV